MKKCSLLVLLLSLMVLSCSKTDELVTDQKGTLRVSSVVNDNIEIITSRADEVKHNLYLILEDEKTSAVIVKGALHEYPDGIVDGIPAGSYKLTLTTYPDGFTPAFNSPVYEGIGTGIKISGGETTNVSIECTQANTGLYFIYDPSLEGMGLANIVPMVTQKDSTLYYEGDHKTSTGYFFPESAELKIKNGATFVPISGSESHILDFSSEQLWEINLKAKQTGGGLAITATVKVITDPTNKKEFELEGETPGEDLLDIELYESKSDEVTFLVKGKDVEALKHGVFLKSSVDKILEETGKTLEELMDSTGYELTENYFSALNSATGLRMGYTGLSPETEYSFIARATKGNVVKAQRMDFVSPEDQTIVPDPDPDFNGPIEFGTYSINIFQDQEDTGEYIDPYENVIQVTKAKQENLYIISGLFDVRNLDLVAEYNDNSKTLTFTGKDVKGNDVLNEITLIFNGGQYYAGILIFDEAGNMDDLVVDIADRKLKSSSNIMQLNLFHPFDFENLGWIEISPAHNPYSYLGLNKAGSIGKQIRPATTRLGTPVGTIMKAEKKAASPLKGNASVVSNISEFNFRAY